MSEGCEAKPSRDPKGRPRAIERGRPVVPRVGSAARGGRMSEGCEAKPSRDPKGRPRAIERGRPVVPLSAGPPKEAAV